jgi:large subunit ribosomal protein L35
MPKLKKLSGAKKRFKVTASGKVKHLGANHRHRLRQKSGKAKGRTVGTNLVAAVDLPRVKTMLGMSSNH